MSWLLTLAALFLASIPVAMLVGAWLAACSIADHLREETRDMALDQRADPDGAAGSSSFHTKGN